MVERRDLHPVYRRFVGMPLEELRGLDGQMLQLDREMAELLTAHQPALCRLIGKILHQGVRYEERGPVVTRERTQRRAAQVISDLRRLGYRVELTPSPSSSPV